MDPDQLLHVVRAVDGKADQILVIETLVETGKLDCASCPGGKSRKYHQKKAELRSSQTRAE
jgi:hypothetical protein